MTTTPSDEASPGMVGSGEAWAALSADSALERLAVDPSHGLSSDEAARRLSSGAPNRLVEPRPVSFARILREEITEPMILLLLAIGALYSVWGELEDAVAIVVIIAAVVLVEVYTEYRGKSALAALQQLTSPTAPVVRDGRVVEVAADAVVPGDIILLRPGGRVPADVRLVDAAGLRVDESALTGESVPVEKDAEAVLTTAAPLAERRNLAFAGTVVVAGSGRGVVVATGMATEVGRITGLVREAKTPRTPLQQAMRDLSRGLAAVALAFSVVIPLAGIAGGQPVREMVLTGLTLAFATIPEELPIIITMVLGVGASRLARRGALIKRLPAAETLGSVSVIVTDKTGTLTENRMAVARLWAAAGRRPTTEDGSAGRRILELASRCHEAEVVPVDGSVQLSGDPIDVAILEAAREQGIDLRPSPPPVAAFGFDTTRRLMSRAYETGDGDVEVVVKGAPETVLSASRSMWVDGGAETLTAAARAALQAELDAMAAAGLRVVAVASKRLAAPPAGRDDTERDLVLAGLIGLEDPPRAEAAASVAAVQQAGIRVLMVTGDHPATARAIADAVGLDGDGEVMTGPELEQLDDTALADAALSTAVFARVTPYDKLRLVRTLQARGEVVAVTGDGVNDAPALREAHVGVAMGETGTDVAREAADVVVTDDNFATIAAAVGEGRHLFDNLRKGIRYYLACKVAIVAISAAGVAVGLPVPFAPIHIVVMELFMDIAASTTFVAEPPEPDLMRRPPRDPSRPFLDRTLVAAIAAGGLSLFASVTGLYLWASWTGAGTSRAQTLAFSSWMVGYMALAWMMRSERAPVTRTSIRSNVFFPIWTAATVATLAVFSVAAPLRSGLRLTTLSAGQWALAVAVPLATAALFEVQKARVRRSAP